MLRLITSQIFFLIFLSYSNAWHEKNLVTRGLSTRLHMLDPPVKDSQKVADEWFEQRLDHFDSQNTERWMQRYFSRYIGVAIIQLCSLKTALLPLYEVNGHFLRRCSAM